MNQPAERKSSDYTCSWDLLHAHITGDNSNCVLTKMETLKDNYYLITAAEKDKVGFRCTGILGYCSLSSASQQL